MTGKQLKNSILQWAIQGKLVPQDPNDEPASVLLERIRTEKARLVKEKKIKRNKNESIIYRGEDNSYYEKMADGTVRCIDSEIPFAIPDSWAWARFGGIAFNRDSERIPLSVSQRNGLEKKYDYYGASGIIDKVDRYLFDKPLLLIGEDGANLINRSTPIAFIARGKYWVNNHAHVLDFISPILMEYVGNYVNGISLVDYVTGTAQPKMNQEKMNSILVPIPSLTEQSRINDRIANLLPIISKYDNQKDALEKLNNSLNQEIKKSILQEAIQGRLVPQIESEGTAEELLEEIEAEKKRLVKEGKLKKSALTASRIFRGDDNRYYEQIGSQTLDITEEIPFEIPHTWAWVRLSTIADAYTGNSISEVEKKSKYTNVEGRFYIGTKDIGFDNQIIYNNGIAIPEQFENNFKIAPKSSVLMCIEGGSAGRKIAFLNQDVCFGNKLCCFSPFVAMGPYIYYYLQSSSFFDVFCQSKSGIIGGVSIGKIKDLLIPIPPKRESMRIVTKIETLFKRIK